MKTYDYIITGTGAAGLMMAYRMSLDVFFEDKQILLIDKEKKSTNDRTWSYWEQESGFWDHLVVKQWSKILFASKYYVEKGSIAPYVYKTIRSKGFYASIWKQLETSKNIVLVEEDLISITDNEDTVIVKTNQNDYISKKVMNSVVLSQEYKSQTRYPVLNQHFIGWFIKTTSPYFDKDEATFMDFKVAQKENTRFMYVLPFSETEALIEYTLFSKDLLEDQEYENEIVLYLEEKGIHEYVITEKEKGCIPMTSYNFGKLHSKNVIHIGTAGGWTKASTGFTFKNTIKKSEALISFLKKSDDFTKFDSKTRFWWYDLLFLDVLAEENAQGSALFSRLFKKNKTTRILAFLDEETTFWQEVRIMASMPPGKFIKRILKRLF